MGKINHELLEKYVSYGDEYKEVNLDKVYDTKKMQDDWWEGSQFLISHAIYQGRTDILSERIEDTIYEAIEKYIGNNPTVLLEKKKFPELKKELEKVIGRGKIGKGGDIKMIIGIFEFISNLKDKNIINHSINMVKNGRIRRLNEELDNIYQIGPKISAFYLRDLVDIYSLEKYISQDDLVVIQPVDTWVRQVSQKIGISEPNDNDEVIRRKIVDVCIEENMSPIKFNEGLWYATYHEKL